MMFRVNGEIVEFKLYQAKENKPIDHDLHGSYNKKSASKVHEDVKSLSLIQHDFHVSDIKHWMKQLWNNPSLYLLKSKRI